ncbi:MATE family efflux transporter [Pseudoalteromonas sp. SR43-6]|jgi:putative MATE family efflux protein|uniref:MATE family efflux transporter n=5 Tax=Pseudoalteromonas TaxID=53246 RepID=A0A4P9J1M0_9GAMM|nr:MULTISPECIES: MATE family efflux transporter [Pseudoalteromonas]MBB1276888.1 MATE family efflux transporter [Pseudoalteromonas sp. SR43-3]MBB1289282.1 MATE family efflux transporter [Pseudoalteromonas sp. SR41-5]MBB1299101.1 MATE family efflux transporter [Pseudoalteromonas sp. SR41-7]MBB1325977.1 MATE family efflux transporter [Pseudoalteromonas sp. SR45-1]MBB1347915.1 MATE family efflux transporter [Pseudoalteromonas sp. SG45-2]|tara:strand:+ start:1094 stop:2473 length:1380 start_codon:yes stop_codon:yes gene_type:complete
MRAISKSQTRPDLLNDPILPTLKTMTIPMIFGMITLMMFNIVDTFFISLLGTEPLAAVSFTFPVTFTVISLAIGLGIGTSAVIAKALGSNKIDEARFDASISLMVGVVLVIVLSSVGYLLIDPIFTLLGAGAQVLPLIHEYMNVWFIGSVFLITPMIGNSVLRASGDTKTPSIVMGGAGLINAVLDPILIFGFGPVPALGIQGAAIASVVAWSVAVVIILYILAVKKRLLSLKAGKQTVTGAIRKILKIGLPAAGANMLTPVAMAVMTALVAHHGPEAVAAFGVGSRIESIASILVLALSMTLPPFVSQNFGAGKLCRVKEAYTGTLKFVMVWQFAIYVLLIAFSGVISQLFGKEQAVIDVIKLFIYTIPLSYGLQGVIILSNSSFNALHKPMNALVLSVIRLFIFYVPFAYIGNEIAGLLGLFIGAAIGNLFTAIVAYKWFMKKLEALSGESLQECNN